MEAGAVAAHVEVPVEGETVCAALARCEATLRDAVRELHVDISVFKLGVERRLEEASQLVGPLGPLGSTVAQLQQENWQLRTQLEALTRQVEALTGLPCSRGTLPSEPRQPVTQNPQSPGIASGTDPASSSLTAARFSSHASFAVSGRTSNPVEEEPIEMDSAPAPPVLQNGHTSAPESLVITQEVKSDLSDHPQEQVAPVAMAMPHLPITATTKIAESSIAIVATTLNPPSSPTQAPPPVVTGSPPGQSTTSGTQVQPIPEFPHRSASAVKTWTPSPVRTMGSARATEKHASVTAVTHPGISPIGSNRLGTRCLDVGGERRRDLLRSQTLPRNIGVQVQRSPLEKLDSELGRPKLKRSQSFGVSSASSIKQVLLEWCRSKTIGYQNIDIQNFSSSWSDGLVFCALVHSFFPTEFDYNLLSATDPRHNFELAFGLAEEKAGCDRLIEVEDMLVMGHKPDPMCIFTYVQSLYNHLRKFE